MVTADGVEIARVAVRGGAGRLDLETCDPDELPRLVAGRTVAVRVDTEWVMSGTLVVV